MAEFAVEINFNKKKTKKECEIFYFRKYFYYYTFYCDKFK